MKTGKAIRLVHGEFNVPNATTCDHRDSPDDVARALDELLKEHGLEIVDHPTGGDWYSFSIAKRPACRM